MSIQVLDQGLQRGMLHMGDIYSIIVVEYSILLVNELELGSCLKTIHLENELELG